MEDVAGVFYDRRNKRRIVVTRDMLLNQLRRESPVIADRFDSICGDELTSLSSVFSAVQFLIMCGVEVSTRKQNGFFLTCSVLLQNASTTFVAALTLLRFGYRLQPGILVRNILENVSMVGHLFVKRRDLRKYEAGRLKSTETISTMKQIIPPFGRLYGFYSDHFAHISTMYSNVHPLKKFGDKNDESLVANILFLKLSLWLIYVTTELVYLDFLRNRSPYFWKKLGDGKYRYQPTEEARKWQEEFLGMDSEGYLQEDPPGGAARQ